MGFIAESAGGFCCAGRDGKIYFRTIGQDEEEMPLRLFKTYKFSEKYQVSKVAYEDGVRSFKFGNDDGNTLWINQDNIFIVDEEQVQKIYNNIKNFKINSFEGTARINPALDIGDKLIIDGKVIIYQGEMSLNKRFIADIKSKISIKQQQETTVKKESQTLINRKVQSRIDEQEGKITQLIGETTENSNKLSQHEQTIGSITDTISSVETKVETVETKVETAQTTADGAVSKANTAQKTADTANTNAQNAQKSADNVSKEIVSTNERVSKAEQTLEGFSQTVSAVEKEIETTNTKIDNLELGGTQLLRGTNTFTSLGSSSTWANATWRKAGSGTTDVKEAISVTDAPNANIKRGARLTVKTNDGSISQDNVPLVAGQTYTISCYARLVSDTGKIKFQYGKTSFTSGSYELKSTSWSKYSWTFTAKANSAYYNENSQTNIYIGGNTGATSNYTFEICGMKLEKGNKATDWSEAPEDIESNVQNIKKTVETTNERLTTAEQTLSGFSQTVSETVEKVETIEIKSTQNSEDINELKSLAISKVDVEYALGTSTSTAPTTGWSTTAPTWVSGKYMWQRTVTTYSNGTKKTSSATCIAGAKGDTGKNGTNGTNGTNGADGKNGIGIKSVEEQYYLSTSNTAQEGGSWKSTQDTWVSGKYIWTRSKVTWEDGTVKYTTPILATGLNTANSTANTAKSTANTAKNTADEANTNANTALEQTKTTSQKVATMEQTVNGFKQTVSDVEERIETTNTKVDNIKIGARNLVLNSILTVENDTSEIVWGKLGRKVEVVNGETYTISAYYNDNLITENSHGYAYAYAYKSDGTKFDGDYMYTSRGPQTKTINNAEIAYLKVFLGIKGNAGDVYKVKLEKGNKVTDWSPAPEDIENTLETKYYTKEDTNSQITQRANEITTTTNKAISTAKTEAIDSANTSTDNKLKNYTNTTEMNKSIDNAKNGAITSANGYTDGKLVNYSTTTQMNTAIDQKVSDSEASITSSANKTITESIENIEVGGTNLLRGTGEKFTKIGNGKWADSSWRNASSGDGTKTFFNVSDSPNGNIKNGVRITRTDSNNNNSNDLAQDAVPVTNGQTYTMSCYARKTSGEGTLKLQYGKSSFSNKTFNLTTAWVHYSFTFKIGKKSDGSTDGTTNIYFGASAKTGVVELCGFKLEKGNKAMDWSPAPEDTDEKLENYYTKTEANAEIAQKITDSEASITSSVNKSISTAKQEAINSANNSTDTKLKNYSTTTQMNTAITQKITDSEASITQEITAKVSASEKNLNAKIELKLDTKKLVSELNASADKISLKAGRLVITSGNFKLDENGNITAIGGKIGGFSLEDTRFSGSLSGTYEYDTYDAEKAALVAWTDETHFNMPSIIKNLLDVDNTGSVTLTDATSIDRIVSGNLENTKTATGSFVINSKDPKNCIAILKGSTVVASLGLGGINALNVTTNSFICGSGSGSDFKGAFISSKGLNATTIRTNEICTGNTFGGFVYVSFTSNGSYFGTNGNQSGQTTRLRGNDVRLYAHSGGGVYLGTSGSTAVTSDETQKDIYELDDKYIEFFNKLKPISYIYKNKGHRNHIGFGARQVETALIESGLTTEQFAGVVKSKEVTISADELGTEEDMFFEELYSLRYEEFIALNTMVIQKQMKEIERLKQRIDILENMQVEQEGSKDGRVNIEGKQI